MIRQREHIFPLPSLVLSGSIPKWRTIKSSQGSWARRACSFGPHAYQDLPTLWRVASIEQSRACLLFMPPVLADPAGCKWPLIACRFILEIAYASCCVSVTHDVVVRLQF